MKFLSHEKKKPHILGISIRIYKFLMKNIIDKKFPKSFKVKDSKIQWAQLSYQRKKKRFLGSHIYIHT